ncbi:MAG TPA: hypothetical protein VFN10_00395, partial [Thermoanaerobaculia bacterium]|nr:hypothetical protein [Thermoanaerobaculia bacterium]
MDVNDPADPLLPPPREGGHHRSARERQRQGPMWGCLKALFWLIGTALVILLIVVGGGWWYLGTSSFEGLVRLRIEKTLEARLGRDVSIGSVQILRSRPQRVILNDLRIANAPGGKEKYFATVRQVEITGGIESFWQRNIRIGRVDVRDPHLWFEVFPEGSPLTHNFPHWKTGPRSKYEIVHVDIGKLFVTGGEFAFLDHRHQITAISKDIQSEITVTRAEDLYAGLMTSSLVRVTIQDYEPFDVDLRGGFRYTPGVLALQSIALKGRGIEAFAQGKLDPLTEGVYDLHLTSRVTLERIKEIFRVDKLLAGTLALDTRLKGKEGDFSLTGGFVSPRIDADAYTLTNAKGRLDVNGQRTILDVERASYGGGTIGAHYLLTKYANPYPMSVELRYDGISIEKLFSDWTVNNTGLRSAATGSLTYHWNKDKVLEGAGEGTARLSKNAVAFSNAKYPMPIGGTTDFAIDNGVVTFRSAELDTNASHVSLTGSLRIEDLFTDLRMAIRTSDLGELDRIGYNFALSADKRDYELLGLDGAGTITGSVRGKLKTPQVVAKIDATNAKYNNVAVGNANLELRYDGNKSALIFDRATLTDANGSLTFTGTVGFPESGPSPTFDLAVESNGYSAQRAVDAVGLDFKVPEGNATGRLIVAGNKNSGRVTFVNVTLARAQSTLKLNGDLRWLPGEGNVA